MDKVELQTKLHELNLKLRSNEVRKFFADQGDEIFDDYLDLRSDVRIAFNKVANANLAAIAENLRKNEEALEEGISSMEEKIDQLEDAIAIMNSIASVLNVVARVVAFL